MADSSIPTPILSPERFREEVLAARHATTPMELAGALSILNAHDEALRQRVTALEDAQTIAEGRYRALDREHEALRDALRTAEAECSLRVDRLVEYQDARNRAEAALRTAQSWSEYLAAYVDYHHGSAISDTAWSAFQAGKAWSDD